jgi:hypothetical protein
MGEKFEVDFGEGCLVSTLRNEYLWYQLNIYCRTDESDGRVGRSLDLPYAY